MHPCSLSFVHNPYPLTHSPIRQRYNWKCRPVRESPVCQGETCIVPFRDDPSIIRVDSEAQRAPPMAGRQTYFDEMAMQGLVETSGWSRNYSVVELLPIAVVAQRDWV